MKKFLLLYVLASVSLASCVNDESLELTQQPKKLSFEAPVMKTQSRALYGEIQGADYPITESFMVFAKQHTGDLTDWESAGNFWVKENAGVAALEVKYDNTEGYWDTDTDHYWPSGDVKLSFGAYSPAVLNTGATATYKNTGLTVANFEVNATVANQVDLMYSGPILNKSYAVETDKDGVDITFKHALSSVVFSAIDADANANYTINSIKVKGKFLKKGTFCENLSAINGSGTAGWSNVSGNNEATEYELATVLNVKVGTSSTVITGGTSALLTIPHTAELLDDDATVTITYKVDPESGATDYVATKTVKLADFKQGEGANKSSITSWEMGNRYTYLFNFGGTSKIFFKPTVTDWVNNDAAILTIN